MKSQRALHASVISLKDQREPENPKSLRPLAGQLASLEQLCEKLLYRVQQLERREKTHRLATAQLRRELTACKKRLATPGNPDDSQVNAEASKYPKTDVAPSSLDRGEPDFGSALPELNRPSPH